MRPVRRSAADPVVLPQAEEPRMATNSPAVTARSIRRERQSVHTRPAALRLQWPPGARAPSPHLCLNAGNYSPPMAAATHCQEHAPQLQIFRSDQPAHALSAERHRLSALVHRPFKSSVGYSFFGRAGAQRLGEIRRAKTKLFHAFLNFRNIHKYLP